MLVQDSVVQKVIDAGLEGGADFAEVYMENTYKTDFNLKDSKPSKAMVGQLRGAGIRLFYGEEQIYTYTNNLSEAALIHAAKTASQAMQGASSTSSQPLSFYAVEGPHEYGTKPWDIKKDKKIDYLFRFDSEARQQSAWTNQVVGVLSEVNKQVQVANSEGLLTEEERNYSNAAVQVIVENNGQREIGFERRGALTTSEFFEGIDFEAMARTATERAILMVEADYAPAGSMPVVIDNGFGGVIFHEACGHGLETTAVAKDASVFCGKLGQKVAEPCVTAVDDGTIPNRYGSLSIDDEGHPTQTTTLIENGILKSYIVDKMGSIKTGYSRTGSGRRQDYRYPPASRMRNTYIAAGSTPLEKMIGNVDYGLYAKHMGGGSVTPGNGAYNFSVQEGYLIRNGQIEKPVKGASLIGTGIDTLSKITQVGREFKLAPGSCGSVSGMIPVTVGQPAILVSELTVGGRA